MAIYLVIQDSTGAAMAAAEKESDAIRVMDFFARVCIDDSFHIESLGDDCRCLVNTRMSLQSPTPNTSPNLAAIRE